MCGIFCSLSRTAHVPPDDHVLELLQRRGPDSTGSVQHTFCEGPGDSHSNQGNGAKTFLNFTSTVLSLRGSQTVSQPIQGPEEAHVLCWNGEAWSIGGNSTQGNDTKAIFQLISQVAEESRKASFSAKGATTLVAQHMASVAGPYAFVFYDRHAGRVFLGRDLLGRRSLLWRTTGSGDLLISSITSGSIDAAWTEIEADGVYCIDLAAASSNANESDRVEFISNFDIFKVPYCINGESPSAKLPSVGDQPIA